MKKILLTVFAVCVLNVLPSQAVEIGKSIGVSLSMNDVGTKVTDDIDNNGTITTTKDIEDTFGVASLFGELNFKANRAVLTIGVDWIPFGAEVHHRSASQSSVKDKAASSGAAVTGTNSGTLDVENHTTWYIQPGAMVTDNTLLYLTFGTINADAQTLQSSISSGSKTVDQTMDGTTAGIGFKRFMDNGGFMRIEYAETDYDKISITTTNSTKITADAENTSLTLSIGKSF